MPFLSEIYITKIYRLKIKWTKTDTKHGKSDKRVSYEKFW